MSNGFTFDSDGRLLQFRESPFIEDFLQHHQLAISHGIYYEYQVKEGIWKRIDENQVGRLLNHFFEQTAPDLWTGTYEERCKKVLAVKAPRIEAFDAEVDLLNLKNVCFRISTGKRYRFRPKFQQSIKLPIAYNSKAVCPKFQEFLREVTVGNTKLADTLAELLGYCLTNEVKAEKIFVLYGNGSNGKSVFLKILQNLVGIENVSSLSVNDLETSPFSRAGLLGKKVNLQSDARGVRHGVFVTETTKAISSGDMIDAAFKFKDHFSFVPFCKLIFATNQYPSFGEDFSMGSKRRLLVLPFNATFLGKKQNKELSEELMKELSGIFNLAIDGLRRLQEQDFHFSFEDQSDDFVQILLRQHRPVQLFVNEKIRYCNGSRVSYSSLHDCFKQWMVKNEIPYDFCASSLSKELAEAAVRINSSISVYKSNGKRGIKNIKIKE